MVYIGIDPGLSGAIAAIYSNREVVVYDTPTLQVKVNKKNRRVYNTVEMADIVASLLIGEKDNENYHFGLEKIHAMPGQGVSSMFKMGEGYGVWKGLIAMTRHPLTLITPQTWKKEMFQGMGKNKDASRIRALELFPSVNSKLKRKKDHDRAEAILIAEYLRRKG